MKSSRHAHLALWQQRHGDRLTPPPGQLLTQARRAIERTAKWLIDHQQSDGHWVAELEGDTILESEFILLLAYLGGLDSPLVRKAGQYIFQAQLEGGGWPLYPGGPADTSVSVKAYFALKLCGHDPASEPMQRARAAILAGGGADAVNSFTRFYLALLGQISYDRCPAVPPEMVLLPRWFPVNILRMSAWSRTILVPLSIMWAHRPVRRLGPSMGIAELFLKRPADWPLPCCPGKESKGIFGWQSFFRLVDRVLKFAERHRFLPFRKLALQKAKAWMCERFEDSDGLGAIFPPMVWSVIALDTLGYSQDSPEVIRCLAQLRSLVIEENDTAHLQPCKSPVWDTAITLRALAASGIAADGEVMSRGVDWLLAREIRRHGDWSETTRVHPGGWCFEYANAFYPDIDDTIMCVMALGSQMESPRPTASAGTDVRFVDHATAESPTAARQRVARFDRLAEASQRAVNWVLAMQNRDGGWGAFDRDNDHEFLCHVPFADHNAMIDPSTPDLTGRVLEMLGQLGRRVGDPTVDRAINHLRRTQQADGSWFGRWGVNYLYGTWQTLVGLNAVGVPHDDPAVVAGANWLLAYQQPSGGWGESPDSYAQPHLRGQGPTTASQTAWAVMGLLAAGYEQHRAVARGIEYLVREQVEDGTWDEPEFTGTGFPLVFYLRYHYYPIYFPLLALSYWSQASEAKLAVGQD